MLAGVAGQPIISFSNRRFFSHFRRVVGHDRNGRRRRESTVTQRLALTVVCVESIPLRRLQAALQAAGSDPGVSVRIGNIFGCHTLTRTATSRLSCAASSTGKR